MTLRNAIRTIIRENADPDVASRKICVAINDKLDLFGNGWFDDDPVMQEELSDKSAEEDDE